jgi:uncharacterized membrane protein YgdD (TMEM256/DUF423 family)
MVPVMHERFPLLAAGVSGAAAVLLGAFGSHVLNHDLVDRGTRAIWETAVNYHFYHALALLGIAAWMRRTPTGIAARRATRAVRYWTAGTILFSGSLYAYALGGPHVLVWVTPFGGLGLIAGWIFAAGAALAPRSEYDI